MILKARMCENFHTTIWRDTVEVDTSKYECFDGKTKEECETILEECNTEEYPELEDVWEELESADISREKYTGEQMDIYIEKND
tara:strand:+ start:155 stop:406 length:252 start_codon:yes stop_codon:yes gene_type:complete